MRQSWREGGPADRTDKKVSTTMGDALVQLIDELADRHRLPISSYEQLIAGRSPVLAAYAAERAVNNCGIFMETESGQLLIFKHVNKAFAVT